MEKKIIRVDELYDVFLIPKRMIDSLMNPLTFEEIGRRVVEAYMREDEEADEEN